MKYFISIPLFLALACGSSEVVDPEAPEPSVQVRCSTTNDRNRCSVVVQYAVDVEAFSNGRLVWYDYDISNPDEKQFYVDGPSNGVFEVEACSEVGCTAESVTLPVE
jgi:hypothetical protein